MSLAPDRLLPPPRASAGAAPRRRPGSVRRTSSVDVGWSGGQGGAMHLVGRARDIRSDAAGASIVLAEGAFAAGMDAERRIADLATTPAIDAARALIGQRAGARLRSVIGEALPGEVRGGTPLHLILDDLASTSLIAPWAWSRWNPAWAAEMAALKANPRHAGSFSRENICAGLRTGSSGLDFIADGVDTVSLRDSADPDGWHAFPPQPGVGMRRARRIDVWRADGLIRIDSAFQDSASTPAGGRSVLHEYSLRGGADPVSGLLLWVEAEPRVLPFAECPAAADNARWLIGTPLAALREAVLDRLKGPAGCTHLNDALRALAEVPILARHCDAGQPAEITI